MKPFALAPRVVAFSLCCAVALPSGVYAEPGRSTLRIEEISESPPTHAELQTGLEEAAGAATTEQTPTGGKNGVLWVGHLPEVLYAGGGRPSVTIDVWAPGAADPEKLSRSTELRLCFGEPRAKGLVNFVEIPSAALHSEGRPGNNFRYRIELPHPVLRAAEQAGDLPYWVQYRAHPDQQNGDLPWTDTAQLPEDSRAIGEIICQPRWLFSGAVYTINVKGYGSFAAVRNQLRNMQRLGVKILLLQGIHPGHSPFEVDDFKAVNADLGGDLEFNRLVSKAHQLGFRILIPWVANHSSPSNPLFREHPHWYRRMPPGEVPADRLLPNPDGTRSEFMMGNVYKHDQHLEGEIPGGFGRGTAQFNLWDPAAREELARYWEEEFFPLWIERGIDGFYGDTGHSIYKIAPGWMEGIIRQVRSRHPGVAIGVEAHWNEAPGFVKRAASFAQNHILYSDGFLPLIYGRADNHAQERLAQNPAVSEDVRKNLDRYRGMTARDLMALLRMPPPTIPSWVTELMLVFGENHDELRLARHIEWSPIPPSLKQRALEAFSLLPILGFRGIPLLNSGQENGLRLTEKLNHTGNPASYDVAWDWGRHPDKPARSVFNPFSDHSPEAVAMRGFFSRILKMRKRNPAFQPFSDAAYLDADNPHTFAAYRSAGRKRALVIVHTNYSASDPNLTDWVQINFSSLHLTQPELAALKRAMENPSLAEPALESSQWQVDPAWDQGSPVLGIRLRPFQTIVLEFAAGLEEVHLKRVLPVRTIKEADLGAAGKIYQIQLKPTVGEVEEILRSRKREYGIHGLLFRGDHELIVGVGFDRMLPSDILLQREQALQQGRLRQILMIHSHNQGLHFPSEDDFDVIEVRRRKLKRVGHDYLYGPRTGRLIEYGLSRAKQRTSPAEIRLRVWKAGTMRPEEHLFRGTKGTHVSRGRHIVDPRSAWIEQFSRSIGKNGVVRVVLDDSTGRWVRWDRPVALASVLKKADLVRPATGLEEDAGELAQEWEQGMTRFQKRFRALHKGDWWDKLVEYTMAESEPPRPPFTKKQFAQIPRPLGKFLLELLYEVSPVVRDQLSEGKFDSAARNAGEMERIVKHIRMTSGSVGPWLKVGIPEYRDALGELSDFLRKWRDRLDRPVSPAGMEEKLRGPQKLLKAGEARIVADRVDRILAGTDPASDFLWPTEYKLLWHFRWGHDFHVRLKHRRNVTRNYFVKLEKAIGQAEKRAELYRNGVGTLETLPRLARVILRYGVEQSRPTAATPHPAVGEKELELFAEKYWDSEHESTPEENRESVRKSLGEWKQYFKVVTLENSSHLANAMERDFAESFNAIEAVLKHPQYRTLRNELLKRQQDPENQHVLESEQQETLRQLQERWRRLSLEAVENLIRTAPLGQQQPIGSKTRLHVSDQAGEKQKRIHEWNEDVTLGHLRTRLSSVRVGIVVERLQSGKFLFRILNKWIRLPRVSPKTLSEAISWLTRSTRTVERFLENDTDAQLFRSAAGLEEAPVEAVGRIDAGILARETMAASGRVIVLAPSAFEKVPGLQQVVEALKEAGLEEHFVVLPDVNLTEAGLEDALDLAVIRLLQVKDLSVLAYAAAGDFVIQKFLQKLKPWGILFQPQNPVSLEFVTRRILLNIGVPERFLTPTNIRQFLTSTGLEEAA